ncbi:hypothetical protein LguiB_014543 [Lonicera macranthoides]
MIPGYFQSEEQVIINRGKSCHFRGIRFSKIRHTNTHKSIFNNNKEEDEDEDENENGAPLGDTIGESGGGGGKGEIIGGDLLIWKSKSLDLFRVRESPPFFHFVWKNN